jgi:transposase
VIAELDGEVDRVIALFSDGPDRLQTIPGVGRRTAEVVVAECGVDMSHLATARHLASAADSIRSERAALLTHCFDACVRIESSRSVAALGVSPSKGIS